MTDSVNRSGNLSGLIPGGKGMEEEGIGRGVIFQDQVDNLEVGACAIGLGAMQ